VLGRVKPAGELHISPNPAEIANFCTSHVLDDGWQFAPASAGTFTQLLARSLANRMIKSVPGSFKDGSVAR